MLAGDHGVRLTFHPHVGTAVELEPQIDRLLAETPLDLCFDTGHHAFWNQDPLAYMAKVGDRIGYVHLKNVDAGVRARVLEGRLGIAESFAEGVMCPLPDGVVDIPAVMRRLKDARFTGPVVVEQDLNETASETPAALARRNLEFLTAHDLPDLAKPF
jgi:inosose dehydratase